VVSWGFLGLAISSKPIIGAALPHLLIAILLWGTWLFRRSSTAMLS